MGLSDYTYFMDDSKDQTATLLPRTKKRDRITSPSISTEKRKRTKEPRIQLLSTGTKENDFVPGDPQQQARIASSLHEWRFSLSQAASLLATKFNQPPLIQSYVATTNEGEPSAAVYKITSKKLETLGHRPTQKKSQSEDDDPPAKKEMLRLDWEEVLFLIDQDNLALYDANERRMSWPAAFLQCFPSPQDPYTTLHYLSFSHLKRLGYIIRRASREEEARSALVKPVDPAEEETPGDVEVTQEMDVSTPCLDQKWWPCVPPGPSTAPRVIRRLSPISFSRHVEEDPNASSGTYSLYKPRKTFSKRNPGPPDGVVQYGSPDQSDVDQLFSALSRPSTSEDRIVCISDGNLHFSFLSISPSNSSPDVLWKANNSLSNKKKK